MPKGKFEAEGHQTKTTLGDVPESTQISTGENTQKNC